MIVVATDAPLSNRNLKRLAKRAIMGLAKTGGIASNGSGDYVISFSTYSENRIPYNSSESTISKEHLINNKLTPLFLATIEATEEAILNSLVAASDMTGYEGHRVQRVPMEKIIKIFEENRKD